MSDPARPDLPKALAARIRGAQEKLRAALEAEVWYERDTPELEARLAAFDANPVGWAERHYPGHSPTSYPVNTHIARARASLERRRAAAPRHRQERTECEAELVSVEREVLERVRAMRPTSGRVPWPQPLPDIARLRKERDRLLAQVRDAATQRAARMKELQRRRDARAAAQRKTEDHAAIRRMVEKGPEHVFMHSLQADAVARALRAYTETSPQGRDGRIGADLAAFVESPECLRAAADAERRALAEIAQAKKTGTDLWTLCRRHRFHTPDSVAALDRGKDVDLILKGRWRG